MEGEGGGESVAVDVGDQEHAPGARLGEQDSDFQLAGAFELPVTFVVPSAELQ